ncbi:hypothetical protein KSF_108730 [Reticulibacter mediterranei]|uniref:Uncharacterized protein n=1 Tax=Reticulibacter mediterranei TaxID=2778369 RepID=A0A8J3N9P8_9CHLR|nr:hypothetical protein KSF_108730 [Reticulibacter mediterranei]
MAIALVEGFNTDVRLFVNKSVRLIDGLLAHVLFWGDIWLRRLRNKSDRIFGASLLAMINKYRTRWISVGVFLKRDQNCSFTGPFGENSEQLY